MEYEKNDDGTLKLDAEGNPIPVKDNTNKEADKELAEVNKNLVEELKAIRKEKQEAIEALEKAKKDEKPKQESELTDSEKLTAAVEQVLAAKELERAKANKKAAFQKFVIENKQYHEDNDSTGLKLRALETKFNEFNTSGLTEVEQFLSKIRDAHTLLGGNDNPPKQDKDNNPYSDTPTPNGTPQKKVDNELSLKEKKLIETSGWTVERYLKTKEKHPQLVADLLEKVRV